MVQTPVYCHISDLDKIDSNIDLIETNRLITILSLGKESEAC